MKNPMQLTKTIDPVGDSLSRSAWRRDLLVIALLFASFALSPSARAVCQDGCEFVSDSAFLGWDALLNNTTGYWNTAMGYHALYSNTTGYGNTATGFDALPGNTVGFFNAAHGISALSFNTSGNNNTANGAGALYVNTTASNNTASGFESLHGNTTGGNNTAAGYHALYSNTTSSSNTAFGSNALSRNTTGTNNIGLGESAGSNLTTGSNNIDIGNIGVAAESGRIRIGTSPTQSATFIAGINGAAIGAGVPVRVSVSGQLGTQASSARFKEAIRPMNAASEALFELEPVTFRYKPELDPEGIPQFGLVAEQVAKVNPDLVARDDEGKPYTVRYEAVNVLLLNEFLKEHRKVEEQEAAITELKSAVAQQRKDFQSTASEQQEEINALIASLREQASQIQRATRPRRVEVSKPLSKIVADNE